ncbi:Aldehyde dehydrogenase [Acidisarcina polymorpha]|uniref:Aldehyde dehydrogenase n=1 Tax=Acidisarcina polymorpha TaxID=2211140 RepID=A0A2Z5GAF6_9BACT|nr:aldehyde dehydrogenase family protein [Acidisarcina polymorpha]AXC15694.1 Aldehyde dehydrogenase [Acidisarcina polymorpha]
MAVLNPASEEVIANAPCADEAQLNSAVSAAHRAYSTWSARCMAERSELLRELASRLESRLMEFAKLLTQEQGMPLTRSCAEIKEAIKRIRYFALFDLAPRVLKDDDSRRIIEQRTPLGVVAAITPWNVPILLLINKVAPSLVTGNTLVIKPAPTTPLTTLLLGEVCADIFPAGVDNVITGRNELGASLTSHSNVAKIAFTGSTATGKKVMESAAGTLKRLELELGGNDPAIVLDDVDPAEIAPKIFAGAMGNSGQICFAIKRVYVHECIYDRMCEELGALARKAVVGNGLDERTEFGPLQNKSQFDRVRGLIEDARKNGTIVGEGKLPPGPGYFVAPTIVRDIADDSPLVQEEQFGPVLPILKYTNLEDAVARANATPFGLGATVWSADLDRATHVAGRIESGSVWINQVPAPNVDAPFGGAKQSGFGVELSSRGLEECTQLHVIHIAK